MTEANLAPDQEDVAALQRRIRALEAEIATLRARRALDARVVKSDSVLTEAGGLVSDARLLRTLLDAAPYCIKVLDPDGRILFMSPGSVAALDAAPIGEIAGLSWTALWEGEHADLLQDAIAAARVGRVSRFQALGRTGHGDPRWWDVLIAPIADGSGRLLAISQDTTARTNAAASRDEKLAATELLLQEVHHRVKNSVQMVQNLLNLQARSCPDPVAAAQLAGSAARVHMIGLIHDRLYRSGGNTDIDLRQYMHDLVHDLHASMAAELDGRTVQVRADAATWPAAEVPPLGLMLTELVINALKYGAGTVQVTFRQPDPENRRSAVLIVEDEGTGLPATFDPGRGTGLGMRLVLGMLRRDAAGLSVDRTVAHTRFVARLG